MHCGPRLSGHRGTDGGFLPHTMDIILEMDIMWHMENHNVDILLCIASVYHLLVYACSVM